MIKIPRRRRPRPDRPERDDRRDDRRDWQREKWENKPRRLLDLITASSGLVKWLLIAGAALYGLRFAGVDITSLLNWGK